MVGVGAHLNLGSGGGGGVTTFIALTDAPNSYVGQTGKALRVNAGETALEFYTPSAGVTTFAALTDAYSLTGTAFTLPMTNAAGTALLPINIFDNVPINVNAATTTTLPAYTYNNGAAGVGATLTGNANGAFPTIDAVAAVVNNRYLIKNETGVSRINNGVYILTTVGTAGTPYVLTRTTDSDQSAELEGQNVIPSAGAANKGKIFRQITPSVTIGTNNIIYQVSGVGGTSNFNDGSGFDGTINGNTLSLTTSLAQNSVPFIGAAGALTENSSFQYDLANTLFHVGFAATDYIGVDVGGGQSFMLMSDATDFSEIIATPTEVQFAGTGNTINARFDQTNGSVVIGYDLLGSPPNGISQWMSMNTTTGHSFGDGGNTLMIILPTGNVGISLGTLTTPASLLSVGNASTAGNGDFQVNDDGQIVMYLNSPPLDGELLIGRTGGGTFEKATATAGFGAQIDNGSGTITISSRGTPYMAGATGIDANAVAGSTVLTFSSLFTSLGDGSPMLLRIIRNTGTLTLLKVDLKDDDGNILCTTAAIAADATHDFVVNLVALGSKIKKSGNLNLVINTVNGVASTIDCYVYGTKY